MRYLKWIMPLTLLYIGLTANAEPLNWVLGLLIATTITQLLRPTPSPINWRTLPMALFGVLLFFLSLLWELLRSSIQVARLILNPNLPIKQGIFTLPANSPSEMLTVLAAEAITVTPGELVVEMDDDRTLYVHSIDIPMSMEMAFESQQRRVQQLEKIFS